VPLDVAEGKAKVGNRVVVIGGRLRGMETAYFLAQQGEKVSLVTRSQLGRDMNKVTYLGLRDKLIEHNVSIYPNSPAFQITDKGVSVSNYGDFLFLPADTVVLAVGSKSENELVEQLKGIAPEIYAIGDCVEPRCALDAIKEGAEIGREI